APAAGGATCARGVDMHASGLEALGATVWVDHGYLVAQAPRGLRGTTIRLDFPSVGATENLVMASVLAEGRTARVHPGSLVAQAPRGPRGTTIRLDFPSVGATENLVMAAVLAEGRTVLDN